MNSKYVSREDIMNLRNLGIIGLGVIGIIFSFIVGNSVPAAVTTEIEEEGAIGCCLHAYAPGICTFFPKANKYLCMALVVGAYSQCANTTLKYCCKGGNNPCNATNEGAMCTSVACYFDDGVPIPVQCATEDTANGGTSPVCRDPSTWTDSDNWLDWIHWNNQF